MKKVKIIALMAAIVSFVGIFLALKRPYGVEVWPGIYVLCGGYVLLLIAIVMLVTWSGNQRGK